MGLFPKNLTEYVVLSGIPVGPLSKVFVVDPQHGSDSNPGTSLKAPLLTVKAAYDLCTTNHNDTVLVVGGPTGNTPAAALDWAKDYTHLIGISGDLPGTGQRTRIVGSVAAASAYVVDFQGDGCVVKNIQFFQGNSAAADSGAAIVSGDRCHFVNCFFAGMGHATAAARAGSYSLKLTGAENTFERCTVGLATVVRGAANAELWLTGECNRNKFSNSEIVAWSVTAGKFLVKLDASAVPYTLTFRDCIFDNLNSNNGATGTVLTDAMSDAATPFHQIILHNCTGVGFTGWCSPVTYIFGAGSAPNSGFGIAINSAH